MSSLRPSSRDDFEIAIICALPLEYDAASYIFDDFWDENGDQFGRAAGDPNSYTTGRVGKYNVVLALLPRMGKANAASAAASMRSSYGSLRLVLLVGVCGGMPRGRDGDILLGDVVISKTVIQYDFGRQYSDKFVRKNTIEDNLSRPNKDISSMLAILQTDRGLDQLEQRAAHFLRLLQASTAQTRRRGKYDYPGAKEDRLFDSAYRHKHHAMPTCVCRDCFNDSDPVCDEALNSSCADLGCDDGRLVVRERQHLQRQSEQNDVNSTPQPAVHIGAVASGDVVMKSAVDRDRLSREAGVIAFEMEGAGVWDEVPCLVVKGVCDYADSHKHKGWQNFAAATAASASKAILERYIRTDKILKASASDNLPRSDLLQECLKSLAFPEMNDRPNDVDNAVQGTCEWLPRHEIYRDWVARPRSLLWIKGKPGSGKSTLMKDMLRRMEAEPGEGNKALILSYFFYGRGSELQKTLLGLSRSLLHQLLSGIPHVLSRIVDVFQQRCDVIGPVGEKWQWHVRELLDFFKTALPRVLKRRSILLFVDALDECGEENAIHLVEYFKLMIKETQPTTFQFRICFSCRHYPILELEYGLAICLEYENMGDIATFVRAQLSAPYTGPASTIADTITHRASGVFMWAHLVVKHVLRLLRKGEGLKTIEAEIHRIPPDLDALYAGLLRMMEPRAISRRLIQWICFSIRPLSIDELRWAMAVDPDRPHKSIQQCQQSEDYTWDNETMDRRIKTLSCGLAETVPFNISDSHSGDFQSRTVQFIHQSVKDFFIEKGLSNFAALEGNPISSDLAISLAHHNLSRTCIRYLAMGEIAWSMKDDGGRDLIHKFPLLHYATTSWVAHAKQGEASGVCQDNLLECFDWPLEGLVQLWTSIYRKIDFYEIRCPSTGASLLHVASRYGLPQLLSVILQKANQLGINIDCRDDSGRTPLFWAAGEGHVAIVKLLLDTGKVAVEARAANSLTPLLWASQSRSGATDVIKVLVENGASLESTDYGGRTPLSWAAGSLFGKAAVEMLVKDGACLESRDQSGLTPLSWAAREACQEAIQILVKNGAFLESRDNNGRTPLFWAARSQYGESAVKILIENGAYIESIDNSCRTPLSWAAAEGYKETIEVLMKNGACLESTDNNGQTPLFWAARNLHQEAAVRVLIENGACLESADNNGQTPLLWVARSQLREAIVKILVESGACLESADNNGRTPLSWAAGEACQEAIQILIENGACLESRDENGRTPLFWAAGSPYGKAVIRVLVENGAYLESRDENGQTPLSWAAGSQNRGTNAVVLIKNGACLESRDNHGRTPLLWAAGTGYRKTIKVLVKHGAYLESRDDNGRTPLSWAAGEGHEEAVKVLVENGACLESADDDGRTPLSWAAGNGYEEAVEVLVENGACLESADDASETSLLWAVKNGHEAVVGLLLSFMQ